MSVQRELRSERSRARSSTRNVSENPKCSNNSYETGEIRTTGSGLSRFLNLQNQKFAHITCDTCGYTEFFKRRSRGAGNILDLFLGG